MTTVIKKVDKEKRIYKNINIMQTIVHHCIKSFSFKDIFLQY